MRSVLYPSIMIQNDFDANYGLRRQICKKLLYSVVGMNYSHMWCFLIIGNSITFYIIWLLFGIALISIFPSGPGPFSALIVVIS